MIQLHVLIIQKISKLVVQGCRFSSCVGSSYVRTVSSIVLFLLILYIMKITIAANTNEPTTIPMIFGVGSGASHLSVSEATERR